MLRLVLIAILAVVLAGCSSGRPAPLVTHDAAWLQGQLAELKSMQCPQGCDAQAWAQMKATLQQTIEQRLAGKQVSAPPTSASAKPRILLNPEGPYLSWYFENPGDYNQDGVVSVSDLTPLGVNLGTSVGNDFFSYQSGESVVDGDRNGEINISDLTPLGANLGHSITEWRLYEASDLSAYPAGATDPSTIAPVTVRAVADSSGLPPTLRRDYQPGFTPDPAKWYWVRSADASGEGIASIAVGGGNLPPVINYSASGFSGAPPFSLHFDASATTDPEGQAIEYLWLIEGAGIFSGPVVDPEFASEGLFGGVVGAIDEMGAVASATFTITSSLGEKWRLSQPDNTHVLDFTDRIRIEPLDSGVAAVAFSSKEGASDAVVFTSASNIAGSTWEAPETLATLDGLFAEVDMSIVASNPALCWISRPTGSPVDTLICTQSSSPFGSGWTSESVTAVPNLVELSICPGGGDALIAYHDGDALSLQYAQGNVFDADPWDIGTIDSSGTGGRTPTLAVINGSPAVAYWHPFSGEYRYADSSLNLAGDVVWNAPVSAGTALNMLSSSLIALPGDVPAFAFYQGIDGFLEFTKAADSTGDAWAVPYIIGGTDTLAGQCLPAMALVRGVPVVVYLQPSTGQLLAAHATDAGGGAWTYSTVSDDVEVNVYPEITEIAGKPAVAFAAADGTPRFGIFY